MTHITVLGIDLAKNVFQLCGLNAAGEVVYTRSVKRKDFTRTVVQLSMEIVAMEACGSSHHWCRQFTGLGLKSKIATSELCEAFRQKSKE